MYALEDSLGVCTKKAACVFAITDVWKLASQIILVTQRAKIKKNTFHNISLWYLPFNDHYRVICSRLFSL